MERTIRTISKFYAALAILRNQPYRILTVARISVEQKALTDPRFDLLAMKLGCDRDSALGRTLRLWNECQERESYDLPATIVSALMKHPQGTQFILESELGEETQTGTIRIKGTKGRIEWLAHARAFGRTGGRPKLQNNNHTDNRTVKDNLTLSEPSPNPPAPAPAPAPTPVKRKKLAGPPTIADLVREFSESGAFPGIDVKNESRKAALWLQGPKGKGRRFTRQFFFNWLGRIEKTIDASLGKPGNGKPFPEYREWLNSQTADIQTKTGDELRGLYQKERYEYIQHTRHPEGDPS